MFTASRSPPTELSMIIRETGLNQAILTGDPGVHPKRVAEVKAWIQKEGIGKVDVVLPSQSKVAAGDKQKRQLQEEKLHEIAARQKDDQLRVYLKDHTRIYVNGKSVSPRELEILSRDLGLSKATVTSEPRVSRRRVKEVRTMILTGKVKEVKRKRSTNL